MAGAANATETPTTKTAQEEIPALPPIPAAVAEPSPEEEEEGGEDSDGPALLHGAIYAYFRGYAGSSGGGGAGQAASAADVAAADVRPILDALERAFPGVAAGGRPPAPKDSDGGGDGDDDALLAERFFGHRDLKRRVAGLEVQLDRARKEAQEQRRRADAAERARAAASAVAAAAGGGTDSGAGTRKGSKKRKASAWSPWTGDASEKDQEEEEGGGAAATTRSGKRKKTSTSASASSAARASKRKATKAKDSKSKRAPTATTKAAATGKKKKATGARTTTPTKAAAAWAAQEGTKPARATWEERFSELQHFQRGYGHCRVPIRYEANPGLARWVQYMRSAYKEWRRAFGITEEGAAAVAAAGGTAGAAAAADENVGKGEKNDAAAAAPEVDEEAEVEERKGANALTARRISRLADLGFEWNVKEGTTPWEVRYEQLKEYKAEFGHTRVPRAYGGNPALGEWCHCQRNKKKAWLKKKKASGGGGAAADDGGGADGKRGGGRKRKNAEDPEERMAKLDEIGFDWNPGKVVKLPWEERFSQLVQFRREHGHCNLFDHYSDAIIEDGGDAEDGDGGDTGERSGAAAAAAAANVDANANDDGGAASAAEGAGGGGEGGGGTGTPGAGAGTENDGGTTAGQQRPKQASITLVRWAFLQRTEYRKHITGHKSKLNKTRIKKLQDIGFDLFGGLEPAADGGPPRPAGKNKNLGPTGPTGPRVPWEERYRQLLLYRAEHGNTRVPQGYPPNPALNRWVNEQRRNYRLKKEKRYNILSDERQAKLEEIGFEFTVVDKKRSRESRGARVRGGAAAAGGAALAAAQGVQQPRRPIQHDEQALPTELYTDSSDEEDDDDDDDAGRPSNLGGGVHINDYYI